MFVASWTTSKRHQLLLSALFGIILLFVSLHLSQRSPLGWTTYLPQTIHPASGATGGLDSASRQRVKWLEKQCGMSDPFETEYGRTNLRMSRGYEGSQHRLRQLSRKVINGDKVTVATIGGSITAGHHITDSEIWFTRLMEWLAEFWPADAQIHSKNGAAPATGSDYFSFCFPLHIPDDSDLVLVELAVNDEGILEHVEDMENLLRGLLALPSQPAVILVEAMAFSNGGMGGGGGRMHLPVAQYYDVPVINQRHPLANHFARYPQLVPEYFVPDWWGGPDTRHINARGHRDLGMLIASFIRDTTCEMLAEHDIVHPHELPSDVSDAADASWPEQARGWRTPPGEGEELGRLMPGMFNSPPEDGLIPRLPVLEGWNPNLDHGPPPFHPVCLSTRSQEPRFNLTPTHSEGWEYWVHPEHLDKPYIVAHQPGAQVTFTLDTSFGVIKMYSLKSKTFGLGTIQCWVDDDRDRAVKIDGWWDKGSNIGRFATIRTDLAPGTHTVTCRLLEETSDQDGGHEFRIISVMSL